MSPQIHHLPTADFANHCHDEDISTRAGPAVPASACSDIGGNNSGPRDVCTTPLKRLGAGVSWVEGHTPRIQSRWGNALRGACLLGAAFVYVIILFSFCLFSFFLLGILWFICISHSFASFRFVRSVFICFSLFNIIVLLVVYIPPCYFSGFVFDIFLLIPLGFWPMLTLMFQD